MIEEQKGQWVEWPRKKRWGSDGAFRVMVGDIQITGYGSNGVALLTEGKPFPFDPTEGGWDVEFWQTEPEEPGEPLSEVVPVNRSLGINLSRIWMHANEVHLGECRSDGSWQWVPKDEARRSVEEIRARIRGIEDRLADDGTGGLSCMALAFEVGQLKWVLGESE